MPWRENSNIAEPLTHDLSVQPWFVIMSIIIKLKTCYKLSQELPFTVPSQGYGLCLDSHVDVGFERVTSPVFA